MSNEPIPFTLTTWTDASGAVCDAMAVRWDDIKDIIAPRSDGEQEHMVLEAALRDSGAPAWALDGYMQSDEQHLTLVGPEAATPIEECDYVTIGGKHYPAGTPEQKAAIRRLLARLGIDLAMVFDWHGRRRLGLNIKAEPTASKDKPCQST